MAVLDTGVAYRDRGTDSAHDPDLPTVTRLVRPKDFVDGDQFPSTSWVTAPSCEHDRPGDEQRLGLTGVAYG